MPVHQFYVRPKNSLWEVDAGDGYRISYATKELAIQGAVEAASALHKRYPSVAVYLIADGQLPEQIWP